MGVLAIVGRVLLSVLFLAAALPKIQDPEHQVVMLSTSVLKTHLELLDRHVVFLIVLAGVVELVGGLLLLGGRASGGYLLALFTLAVTVVVHDFWSPRHTVEQALNEQTHFLKNLAIVGGLLCAAISLQKDQAQSVVLKSKQD